MHRLTITFGQMIVLILALASANTQLNALGINSNESKTEQRKSAHGRATCYSYSFEAPLDKCGVIMPSLAEPVEMAYRLFELNPDHFHMNNPRQELVLKRFSSGDFSIAVSFKQAYNGVDLLGSDITVHFSQPQRGPYTFTGTYCGNITLSRIPQIDSTGAHELAILAFKEWAHSPTSESLSFICPSMHLAIWHSNNDTLYLIWIVRLIWAILPDRIWEYYIDAHDGTVLRKAEYNNY